jgi:hypothetical protein
MKTGTEKVNNINVLLRQTSSWGLIGLGVCYALNNWLPAEWGYLKALVELVVPTLLKFSVFLLILAATIFFTKGYLEKIWKEYLSVPHYQLNEIVQGNLESIRNDTKAVADKVNALLLRQQLAKPTLDEHSKHYNEMLIHAGSHLYSEHIENPDSWFGFIKSKLLDPYCIIPHKSECSTKITVAKHSEGVVRWDETTNYKIHHVLYKTRAIPIPYDVIVASSAYVPSVSIEQWSQQYQLIVKCGKDILINNKVKPTVISGAEISCCGEKEGFFCWEENGWFNIRFLKSIELKSEWTDIYTHEVSLNSAEDKNYTYNSIQPAYKHHLQMTLPDGCSFVKDIHVSNRELNENLPGHGRRGEREREIVIIGFENDSNITIDIHEWVLPGVVYNLNWK